MEYGKTTWSDTKISRIVQGTIMLTERNKEEGFRLLDAVWDTGINAFDAAALYGGGTCERVLGEWMEARGNREESFVIGKSAHHNADRRRVTPFDVTADLHDSLARQRTEYQDLHLLHRDDPTVDVGPIVEILNEHLDAGRIRAFGGSNWSVARLQEANEYADRKGLTGFVASSPNLSLANEIEVPWEGCLSVSGPQGQADREWYHQMQMPLFTWSSIARGFFTGRLTRDNFEAIRKDLDQSMVHSYCYEENFQRLDRTHELAAEKGVSVPLVALAWVLRYPDLDVYPLVGARTPEEAADNAQVFGLELTPAEREWLDLRRDSRD